VTQLRDAIEASMNDFSLGTEERLTRAEQRILAVAFDPKEVGRIIDEHYRARRDADPKGPPLHECGSYCGADIAERLALR
jgi:hypothetical protein